VEKSIPNVLSDLLTGCEKQSIDSMLFAETTDMSHVKVLVPQKVNIPETTPFTTDDVTNNNDLLLIDFENNFDAIGDKTYTIINTRGKSSRIKYNLTTQC